MKLTDKDFVEMSDANKEKIINEVVTLTSHNFINKDALIEIIKYQYKKESEYGSSNNRY